MTKLPMFFSTGLLCAGLMVGCADSTTPETSKTDAAENVGGLGAGAQVVDAAWVTDDSVTQAHLEVSGMV